MIEFRFPQEARQWLAKRFGVPPEPVSEEKASPAPDQMSPASETPELDSNHPVLPAGFNSNNPDEHFDRGL